MIAGVVVTFALLLGQCRHAFGHFLWLKEDLDGNAVVTFSEAPGQPGPSALLSVIADKTTVASCGATGRQSITLSTNKSRFHSELVGRVTAMPPFSLRLAATFGLFRGGSLLQYWGSADVVTRPNDWFAVQSWAPQRGLEITIRDPWMNRSRVDEQVVQRLRSMDPGDECVPHAGPMQDGAACVVAVIRFNGELIGANLEVDTYVQAGTRLNTTHSQSGVTILKVPYSASAAFTAVWAKVNYREKEPGTYEGQAYTFVDHWATTYARIVRAPAGGSGLLII